MAPEALAAKPGSAFRRLRQSVRIVAGAAPQAVSRCPLACALRQFFDMPGDRDAAVLAGLDEYLRRIREPLARLKGTPIASRGDNPDCSRKMALRADAIPLGGRQF